MEDIELIYKNDIGLSFYWKDNKNKIQVVFREMGFRLDFIELKLFREKVVEGLTQSCCHECQAKNCRSLLLKTPSEKIDVAVNREELEQINDLLGATILKFEINDYLTNFSAN